MWLEFAREDRLSELLIAVDQETRYPQGYGETLKSAPAIYTLHHAVQRSFTPTV